MDAPKRICLGVITGAHGIQGAVRIKSFTEVAREIESFGPLSDAGGAKMFEVRVESDTPKGLIARIAGIDDRNAAEALKGTELYVGRGALPAEDEDEYYYADLVGLAAEGSDGNKLGVVKAMNNFGAGEVMEIELEAGGSVMIPFTKSVVPLVDLAAGRMVADPPPGLMPDPRKEASGSKKRPKRIRQRDDG
jgi:16S rRNA processing protein RimM